MMSEYAQGVCETVSLFNAHVLQYIEDNMQGDDIDTVNERLGMLRAANMIWKLRDQLLAAE